MTKGKDLKRRVRARMQKTGESYTAARASLVAKREPKPRPEPRHPALPADYQKIAGMSDAKVEAATGKTWPQWVDVLDEAGAAGWEHRAIADHLHERLGVPGWWTQMVTVAYERLRGLREVGQRRGGGYDVNKSKTLAVPARDVWRAFADARRRRKWLPDLALQVSTAVEAKTVRAKVDDGSRLDVYFTAKGEKKTAVAVQHRNLPNREAADRTRRFWAEKLDALKATLEAD
jgi:uncharacterized protein YndB with AHSA1/START domain